MATFAELGYKPKDKNGKKQFNAQTVSISKLYRVSVKLIDFEYVEHVRNFNSMRIVLLLELEENCEVGNKGTRVKTWTGSLNIQN